jgi:peptidoglycan/xylan/chitin deacetylase (PgdA/CDA1 family)
MLPKSFKFIVILAISFLAAGCCPVPIQSPASSALPPVRFLLTFDDGPSSATSDNPTAKIADILAFNVLQPKIKAVFFVQTRWAGAGGSPTGQALMRRLVQEGHVLGLHSGSARGHISHPKMSAAELDASLRDGIADIRAVSGEKPCLVRPPYWEFSDATRAAYQRAGLGMLSTDVSARDGSAVLFQVDPRGGGRIECDLACVRHRMDQGDLPVIDGVVPVVMTFHDPNRYTARHLTDYLSSLLAAARKAGLRTAEQPFYTDSTAMRQAARARAYFSSNEAPRVLKECAK